MFYRVLLLQKINSFLRLIKKKRKDEEVSSFDISEKQKCFIIKVKNKYKSFFPQESGGGLFSYIKKFKNIKKVYFYLDSLDFDKTKSVIFFFTIYFWF